MKKAHFYKACSRLGTKNIPWRAKQLNIGVENGPDVILSPDFLSNFCPAPQITTYKFPSPDEISEQDYFKIIAEKTQEFIKVISNSQHNGETQAVIGGDRSVALASIIAQLEKTDKEKFGLIWIDSHIDLLDSVHSVTKNFIGMFARVLFCDFENNDINSLCPNKIPATNVIYIGNLELNKIEKQFLRNNHILNITRNKILKDKYSVVNELNNFLSRFTHLHVSFDIDVFDQSLVQATGTTSLSGFFAENIFPTLDSVCRHPNISLDLVEVNPQKSGAAETITLAKKVLLSLLK